MSIGDSISSDGASKSYKPADRKRIAWVGGGFVLAILGVWFFPIFWYTHTDERQGYFWFAEQSVIPGWEYSEISIAKSAEAVLVADRIVSGEFRRKEGLSVQVFSAKRYQEAQNEIGLFVHTPDRCWTEAGWSIEPASPDLVEMVVHGLRLRFERRIFEGGAKRELVYFCGLLGGQALPFRLDHNLSVGMKHRLQGTLDKTGTSLRASDSRLWTRVWEAFMSRRPLMGPKQFLRISTPVSGDVRSADKLLQEMLPLWLNPTDYQAELHSWQRKKA